MYCATRHTFANVTWILIEYGIAYSWTEDELAQMRRRMRITPRKFPTGVVRMMSALETASYSCSSSEGEKANSVSRDGALAGIDLPLTLSKLNQRLHLLITLHELSLFFASVCTLGRSLSAMQSLCEHCDRPARDWSTTSYEQHDVLLINRVSDSCD